MSAPALGAVSGEPYGPFGAELERRIEEAASAIGSRIAAAPRVAMVLGSGLGQVVELLDADDRTSIPYREIPHVPNASVGGHAGELVVGRAGDTEVAILSGRAHPYEGYTHQQVTIAVRALIALGVETLVVTNAAGGLHPSYEPGDLMLVSDHINLSGDNPLRGPNLDRFGERFPAMTDAFDAGLRAAAREAAQRAGVPLREGVYIMLAGPNYETRAEMRMLRLLGADAVGMSTVPEVLVARHARVRVLGFSLITNKEPAADEPETTHDDVLRMGERGAERLVQLVRELLPQLA
ncbi:MAG: purine-nucleoside phosphorylase [Chloroflexota bacterium]|nr:purine-nucleoside phosphorylase [Chloroflexota bacterium]